MFRAEAEDLGYVISTAQSGRTLAESDVSSGGGGGVRLSVSAFQRFRDGTFRRRINGGPAGDVAASVLEHRARRRRVQLPLHQAEAGAELQRVPEAGGGEAGPEAQQVPEAGPGGAVLLEHQGQLEGGHHAGVVGHALQALDAAVRLQQQVQDAAPQAAGLAPGQAQDVPGDAAGQGLRDQHLGAVQPRGLGPGEAALQQGGQLQARPLLQHPAGGAGLRQGVVPVRQL